MQAKERRVISLFALCALLFLDFVGAQNNSAPFVYGGTQFQLNEDSSFSGAQVLVYDADGDTLLYQMDASLPAPCGTVTFSSNGYFAYTAGQDCTGIDEVPINVTEQRLNGVTIQFTLQINLVAVNDGPSAAWLETGAPLSATPSLLEQLTPLTLAHTPYTGYDVGRASLTLLAWDVDEADSLQLTVNSAPANGTLTTRCFSPPASTDVDCLALNNSALNNSVNSINSTELDLGLVCALPWRRVPWNISWVACELTYQAQVGFFGVEQILVSFQDGHNVTTSQLQAQFYVLENLCQHDSNCTGNMTDTVCHSDNRSSGFSANYYCACHPGYTGRFCEEDINECLAAECAWNETCLNLINAYRCECPKAWPCYWLLPLAIGGGVSLLVAVVLIIIPICLIYRLRRRRAHAVVKEDKAMIMNVPSFRGSSSPSGFSEDPSLSDDYFGGYQQGRRINYISAPAPLPRMEVSDSTSKKIFVRRPPGLVQRPPTSVRPPRMQQRRPLQLEHSDSDS